MRTKKGLIVVLIVVLSVTVFAVNFPLEEITPGLIGIGKTVFEGTKVEDFPIEVLGLVPNGGIDYVLIKVGGRALELGGVAEGMSGSPIYIEGKLLGAISYGFNDYDHAYCLVTPIEKMEEMLSYPQESLFVEPLNKDLELRDVNTPLVFNGLGERSRGYLEKQLGYKLSKASVLGRTQDVAKLEPGSSLSVELVTGDVTVGSFGTLTNIYEDGSLLAFGHSLLNKGNTVYLAGTSTVHAVVKGQPNTFKLASFGEEIGMITQDRKAGIAGKVGQVPVMIPVKTKVNDFDLKRTVETKAEVVPDNMLLGKLAISTVLEGFDRGIDRVGSGTSKVKFSIKGKGLPYTLERENYFYSYADVSALSLSELAEVLDLILFNDYYNVDLTEIVVEANFTEARNTAVITNALPKKKMVNPGDEVEVFVQIRPFRGEAETVKVKLPIPKEALPGKVHVIVRPGISISSFDSESVNVTEKLELHSDERKGTPISQEAKDWEKLLKDFLNREKNNEIVVEFYPPYEDNLDNDLELTDPSLPVQVRVATDYVMEGDFSFELEIISEEEN